MLIGWPEPITRVDEYDGGPDLCLAATQLGTDYTPTRARRVVEEWVEYFSSGPGTVTRLRFVSRTPARLFAALESQTQLVELVVKWGDYADLRVLRPMSSLTTLALRGASRVNDVETLGKLTGLRTLSIEGFRQLDDPSPLARLVNLVELELGGNWMAPRTAHLPSIGFLRDMVELRALLLHTVVVDDKDYSPVLDLPNLEKVRIKAARGMRPSIDELKAALPWDG